jgi:hypothetical protein
MNERIRMWREPNSHRSIHTSSGPLVVHQGQFVVVAICDNAEQAARLVAVLDPPPRTK